MARTPHEPQLHLVAKQHPPREIAASARRAVAARAVRPVPRPPEGIAPARELAAQARAGLAGAVRLARWAEGMDRPSREAAERAAARLGTTARAAGADWDRARLAGLVELHGDRARPGWRLRAWDRDDGAVLRGWVALFDAWSFAHPAPAALSAEAVAETVEAMPQVLALLHLSDGPVTVPALLDLLRQRVAELRTERCEVPYGEEGTPVPGGDVRQRAADDVAADDLAAADTTTGAGVAADTTTADASDVADTTTADATAGTTIADATAHTAAATGVPDGHLPALLAWALAAFASVGALTVHADETTPESRDTTPEPHETTPEPRETTPAPGEAVLTPLGHWAVWTKLEQICVAAQSPAGNIEEPAVAMLCGCADLSPGPARAEYRAWLAARPTGSAVAELLDAARGDDALVRGLAFEALRVVGAPAAAAVREARAEPVLRPYALLWLAEQDGADPDEAPGVLTRAEATWLWVDTAAAVADHGEGQLLVRHLDSAVQGTVPELLAEVRGVGHPRTVQVLVALAAAHPDPALAKAVRRAAFEVHTGGA